MDESFAKGGYYYIAGMLIKPEQVQPLSLALDAVVAKAAEEYGVPSDAELHGHPLVQGKEHWAVMDKEVRARIGVYGMALDAIATHVEKIYIRGVHRRRFQERYEGRDYTEHGAVLTFVYENLDRYAEREEELVLCIADECSHEEGARSDLKWYQTGSTWGYKARQITRIIDTCHFVPSHASRMIQAVDLCAYLHRRRWDHKGNPRSDAATKALYERIEGQVTHQKWFP